MPAPVVVYTKFESAIDEKNRHKSIMLSCLAVSRISTIQIQLQVFHASHEDESDLRLFMDYLIQLQESVKRQLFNELPLESDTEGRERLLVYICVFLLSQETGEWQGKTSCICGRRILEWCWGETLWGWTIHFHLLPEVQSTTLIQQGELSIVSVLPQWISL